MSLDNEFVEPSTRLFDRMVDGELSDREQSELLRALDSEPDGWRRLALTYVEAQSWGREFRQVLAAGTKPVPALPAAAVPERSGRSSRYGRHVLMAAACCLGAAIGTIVTWRQLTATLARPVVAESESSRSSKGVEALDLRPETLRKRQTVRVRPDDSHELVLPVVEASQVNPDWLNSSSVLSASARESLRREGHAVEESRQLIPFQLEDGRWGVVPVDEVRFVSRREFH